MLKALFLLLGALAAPAAAQAEGRMDMRASELFSREVVTPPGETLGRIEDVLVDPRDGRVRYAVLARGLLDERRYPYPLTALKPVVGSDRIILDVRAQALEGAPGLDRAGKPAWEEGSVSTASLIGRELRFPSGQRAGSVEDVVLDFDAGRVRHVLVAYEPVFRDQIIGVPFTELRIPGNEGPVTLGQGPEPRETTGYQDV